MGSYQKINYYRDLGRSVLLCYPLKGGGYKQNKPLISQWLVVVLSGQFSNHFLENLKKLSNQNEY